MNYEDTGRLLAYIAAFDRRTTGRADVLAWHDVLGDLDYEPCKAAVRAWYADSAGWIMPAHIRAAVLGRPGSPERHPSAVPVAAVLVGTPQLDQTRNTAGLAAARAALNRRTPTTDPETTP